MISGLFYAGGRWTDNKIWNDDDGIIWVTAEQKEYAKGKENFRDK